MTAPSTNLLAIGLIVVGSLFSAFGLVRLVTARRQVLTPGEVPRGSGLPYVFAGDAAVIAGILMLVL